MPSDPGRNRASQTGVAAPRYLFGDLAYLVTDKRVLVRRGRFVRSMERRKLTYARIVWHRSVPVVGHLELVVAVPFGPLARRLRVMLRDVREPDRLLALVRRQDTWLASHFAQISDRAEKMNVCATATSRCLSGSRPLQPRL